MMKIGGASKELEDIKCNICTIYLVVIRLNTAVCNNIVNNTKSQKHTFFQYTYKKYQYKYSKYFKNKNKKILKRKQNAHTHTNA